MIQKRYQPGTFITTDNKYLYAFGGDSSSVERIDQKANDRKWELLWTNFRTKI